MTSLSTTTTTTPTTPVPLPLPVTFQKPSIILSSSPSRFRSLSFTINNRPSSNSRPFTVVTATPMTSEQSSAIAVDSVPNSSIKLLFVEMGVGYDQHGQDITSAAMRACRDAISSNSIPAFRKGPSPSANRTKGVFGLKDLKAMDFNFINKFVELTWMTSSNIPGVSFGEMKLQIKLGVPQPLQHLLDIEKVKSVFPYGTISNVEVVDGGLICSSGVHVEEMGDKNDDCYIVNAAVYVGY
ncbi:hypothetical protein BUALT_Bualt03G0047600 [Buddleja alternifolia]|uniref:Uncharacterized protein n=1 Tax=Buddleja alternifolia TaxID=168488 RepID=A0AAV6XVH3_9LAMI|nr:hypothetical protein BUALT_Bualt03G0047600 [Buddleja alternifolia]